MTKKKGAQVSPEAEAGLRQALEQLRETERLGEMEAAGRAEAPEEAVAALAAELSKSLAENLAENLAVELAAALAREGSVSAARLAQALAEAHPAKEARRAFKRALYLLEQKGVKLAPRPAESVLKAPQAAPPPAYVSLPDPAGHQMVIAAVPAPTGYDACLCSVSPEGVEHFILVNVPRKGLRALARRVEEDSGLPVAETAHAHARLLLEEARDISAARGRSLPAEFAPFMYALEAVTPRAGQPPVYGQLDEAEVAADAALIERAPTLLEGIGMLWTLPPEDVQPYVAQLEEAEGSGLVLSREQRQERLLLILDRAARELFDDERRRAWRRRLEESAFVLASRGKKDEARVALAAALDLKRGLGEVRPNPLAVALVTRSIAPLLAEHKAQKDQAEEETPSLIIKPGGGKS